MMKQLSLLFLPLFFLAACAPATAATPMPPTAVPPTPLAVAISTPMATLAAPPTITAIPTSTPSPTAAVTATPSPTFTPSPTPLPTVASLCADRIPSPDDLLVIVTGIYGLSPQFAPPNIVPLSDYFGVDVTKGYPSEIRASVAEPLRQIIAAMQAEGLAPQIISGYRSYSAQAVAFQKWVEREPERATMLSARPGHSEHQLGTTVDFGSPTLYEYVEGADPTLEFHTYFFKTPEGVWLLAHAHEYGFTLSYPREAQGVTGFFYEPWHYRYVGVDLATLLKENAISLTEYLLVNNPAPCGDE